MLKRKRAVQPGRPAPLGATWDGRGVNFALFSQHAEKVQLCLFDKTGRRELERIPLPEYTDQVWHGYYGDLHPGVLYGYRVYGPYDPGAGHRFNPNKLLVDPYAKALHGALQPHSINFGYRFDGSPAHLSFDRRNNARYVPKCRVVEPGGLRSDSARPRVPWQRTVLYELHVRGFTKLHPEVPLELRGTFAGLAEPPVLEHLTRLGVTSIELLPVHPIVDGLNLAEAGLCNYWGYNSYNFFALDGRYLAGDAPNEFRTMVDRLHEAGLEVILDVVYNHTGEGNQWGSTVSFRGIDNASYYRLAEDRNCYIDDTGCGNTLNLSHPRVLQMVMDSLRYWAQEAGVDGFRFDLATTLAREIHGFDPGSSFLDAVRQDPVLSSLKLIAEPWDLGPGGYQLGNFPPGWSEWNDKYRDTVRSYWRSDEGMLGEFAHRLAGSSEIFERDGRRPWSSINFVTSHDGFTLEDLVSYDHKHNEANLEGNADGSNHNFGWNCGAEGPTEDPSIRALRARQKRNMLTTLLFSMGVPMLVAGDEFGRTQSGNNNAYCQDNEISWACWEHWSQDTLEFLEFVRKLLWIRSNNPAFQRCAFFNGGSVSGASLKDATWLSPDGREMTEEDWHNPAARCLGLQIPDVRPRDPDAAERRGPGARFLLLFNAAPEPLEFSLPALASGERWEVLIDTARPAGTDVVSLSQPVETLPVEGRSAVVMRSDQTS